MKKTFTLRNLENNKKATFGLLAAFLFAVSVIFVGCYEFRSIYQPEQAYINNYFDVQIVAQEDADDGNDWSVDGLQNIGYFGVMLPDGWSVKDSIVYTIVSTDEATTNTGFLVFSADVSQTYEDSIPSIDGYHWWGSLTDRNADMYMFDSLYFSPRIMTGAEAGEFHLRYAIGDADYWDRNPNEVISEPLPITIIDDTGINEMLSSANISLYPNPTSDVLSIDFNAYMSETVSMKITDLSGKIHMSKILQQSKNSIDVSRLADGMYVVQLSSGARSYSTKIMLK